MNKLALVAVPIGILAAAACAVPWYVGMQAEQAMRTEATKLAGSAQFPLNVTYTRYERGWLTSNAVSRLTLKAEPGLYLQPPLEDPVLSGLMQALSALGFRHDATTSGRAGDPANP